MGATITVQVVGVDGVVEYARRLPGRLDKAEKRGIQKSALAVLRRVRERISYRGGYSAEYLHTMTGKLRQSANASDPESVGNGWQARVGFRQGPAGKYAPVHEFGATIRAKAGGYLRFKVGDRGAPTASAARTLSRRAKLTGRAQGFSGRGAERWVMVKQVTIPARAPLRTSLTERRGAIRDILAAEMDRALRGG